MELSEDLDDWMKNLLKIFTESLSKQIENDLLETQNDLKND